MNGVNPIYKAILDSVSLNGTIECLKEAAEAKLTQQFNLAANHDEPADKLDDMKEALALAKFIKLIDYIRGDGVPESVMCNYEKHLDYILSVFK